MYFRGAAVIVVVYDVTSSSSFNHDAKNWINQLEKNRDVNDVVLVLVGNKVDLDSNLREVDKDEAREYAESIGAYFWETSAKSGFNIENMFMGICLTIDETEHIKMKLTSDTPTRERGLTVLSESGDAVEASKTKSRCFCN